jgi:hypothetical protein
MAIVPNVAAMHVKALTHFMTAPSTNDKLTSAETHAARTQSATRQRRIKCSRREAFAKDEYIATPHRNKEHYKFASVQQGTLDLRRNSFRPRFDETITPRGHEKQFLGETSRRLASSSRCGVP